MQFGGDVDSVFNGYRGNIFEIDHKSSVLRCGVR